MSRRIKEELKDLESIMRVLIRAAGGFGKGAALGSEYAARAAHLWHDGQTERLRVCIPEWEHQIRAALRPNLAERQSLREDAAFQQELSLEEEPQGQVRIHKVDGSSSEAPAEFSRMFVCRAKAEGDNIALSHQKALEKFLSHIHIFVKDATVTIKTQE